MLPLSLFEDFNLLIIILNFIYYFSMQGELEFIDTSDMTSMNTGDHYLATDVEWDPTGRYVVTSVSYWGHKMENAYWIWNFQGRLIHKQVLDKFCQFSWRPRPPSLLSEEHIKVSVRWF